MRTNVDFFALYAILFLTNTIAGVSKMKKFFSLLFCLLLFSGCSQPAAEESSSPTANTTPTSTIEATSVPTATPSPTPYSGSKIEYFENIINYNFYATSNAVQKRPEDFTTEEEFYEFIYQD